MIRQRWTLLLLSTVIVGCLTERSVYAQYRSAPTFVFDVRERDGQLMVGITNPPTQEVLPDSPTRWSCRGVDSTLEFKLSGTGQANILVLHQYGIRQTARQIGDQRSSAGGWDGEFVR